MAEFAPVLELLNCAATPCLLVLDIFRNVPDDKIKFLKQLADLGYGVLRQDFPTVEYLIMPMNVECVLMAMHVNASRADVVYLLDRVRDFTYLSRRDSFVWDRLLLRYGWHPSFATYALIDDLPFDDGVKEAHQRWLHRRDATGFMPLLVSKVACTIQTMAADIVPVLDVLNRAAEHCLLVPDVFNNVPNKMKFLKQLADLGYGVLRCFPSADLIMPMNIECVVAAISVNRKVAWADIEYLLDRVKDFTFILYRDAMYQWNLLLMRYAWHPALAKVILNNTLPYNAKMWHGRWLHRRDWIHAVVSQ
jgi:hypothetical protein